MTSIRSAPAAPATPILDAPVSGAGARIVQRLRATPVWVVLIQTFIGLGWLRAATEKVIDGDWWSGAVIQDYLAEHANTRLPWFDTFAELFVEPNLNAVIVGVVMLQAMVGLALVTGLGRRIASLPFMRTLDPMAVIDDPAVMLATFGGLVSACTFLLIDQNNVTPGVASHPSP